MLDKFTNRLRYFIELSYNGTDFHGWQSQPNAITVQETIENSLQLILKNKDLKIIGAPIIFKSLFFSINCKEFSIVSCTVIALG